MRSCIQQLIPSFVPKSVHRIQQKKKKKERTNATQGHMRAARSNWAPAISKNYPLPYIMFIELMKRDTSNLGGKSGAAKTF